MSHPGTLEVLYDYAFVKCGSWGSSVSIVSGYGLDDQAI
jgi:hypothetical protein